MKKYQLREGEKFIEDYIDSEGKHVTIFEDINGQVKHGWVIDIDEELLAMITKAAALEGLTVDDFIDNAVEQMLTKVIEENEKRKAIEELSE